MSRRIIIVTAVHAPSAPFLTDAYKSLCAQELPNGTSSTHADGIGSGSGERRA